MEHKEIDIIGLAAKVLKRWKMMLCFATAGAVVGIVVALGTPREYTSSVILAPEMSSGGLGLSSNLADMASSFGIDLGKKSAMDAIYPEIYPDIFASTDFITGLFNIPVRLKDDNKVRTYREHLKADTKSPFWQYPKLWLMQMMKKPEAAAGAGKADPLVLSREDMEICEVVSSSITCFIDKKTSEITLSITDQDPMVAAIMADTLQIRLQSYITEYRTKKARTDYDYYCKLAKQLKADYDHSRNNYTSYADANQDVILKSYETKETELENDMQSKYDNYKSTLALMRQAKAKIQERTPAFTIIQSAKMPYKPSSRSRALTVIIFTILGVIIGAGWVLLPTHKRE